MRSPYLSTYTDLRLHLRKLFLIHDGFFHLR